MARKRRTLLGRKGKKETSSETEKDLARPFFSVPEELGLSTSAPDEPGSSEVDTLVPPEEPSEPIYAPLPSIPPPSSDADDGGSLPEALPDAEPSYVEEVPAYVEEAPAYVEEAPGNVEESADDSSLMGGHEYSSAGMNLDDAGGQDADFMSDLYGAFDEAPPTEEVPSGLYQDVSQPYNAPMNVPEPPPIPGIADRFTPPPIAHSDIGSRNPDRPSYLATPTPAPEPRTKLPPAPPPGRKYDDNDDDARRGPPMGLILAAFGVIAFAFVAIGLVLFLVGTQVVAGTPADGPLVDEHEGVEVRGNMRQTPKVFGEVEDDGTAPVPDDTDAEPTDDDGTDDSEAGDDEAAEPAPSPAPRPTPRAAPAPRPASPAPKKQEAVKGTLKIRSNRRVLVYVNGAAVGYTPQDLQVSPRDYSVSAMVPGQPGTKQTIDTNVAQPGATQPVEFSF